MDKVILLSIFTAKHTWTVISAPADGVTKNSLGNIIIYPGYHLSSKNQNSFGNVTEVTERGKNICTKIVTSKNELV